MKTIIVAGIVAFVALGLAVAALVEALSPTAAHATVTPGAAAIAAAVKMEPYVCVGTVNQVCWNPTTGRTVP